MILEAVLQMLRSVFLCDTDIAWKNRYYNINMVEVWGQHEMILVFLTGTVFAGTFCTHLEHGD